ncbi:MAG: hypothetical protein IT208_06700 [Chthonomonadales bacterium]|nr:hypothetical protein [Chthonomonadales bacterium]
MCFALSWALAAALALVLAPAGAGPARPFTVGIELPNQVPVTPAVQNALRDMGVGYFSYYLQTFVKSTDRPASETNPAMIALAGRLGADYSIATYEADPPEDAVRAAAEAGREPGRRGRFRGMVFDELAHIRLLNFERANPLADYRSFRSVAEAYDQTLAGYERLRHRYEALGSPCVATHVFPVLLHVAARAGFTPCPKICKEFYSPVSLAIGMGAARQYGRDLWADCDLWFYDLVPGHTPEEFRSNLLLAYWLGVDLVYVEGAGFNLYPAGGQGIPFSLMTQITPEVYQLTAHGEVLRWFTREYLPAHPRAWTFRDVRPNAAIVRLDDTCWGQRHAPGFTRGLFGSETLPSTPDTEAWFGIWNLLTMGRTGADGISWFKGYHALAGQGRPPRPGVALNLHARPVQSGIHTFWTPLNGVVVYDHTADYALLKGIPLLFATGVDLSAETIEALRRCVREGAVCVGWGPLMRRKGFDEWREGVLVRPEGKGRWVLTDDFGQDGVFREIAGLIGRPDEIRYRFGEHTVVLRRITDNEVAVEVDGRRQ